MASPKFPAAAMPTGPEPVAMATVIPLISPKRAIDAQLATAARLLECRAGDRASELPAALGRLALRAERLLAGGPAGIDPTAVDPGTAVAIAERVLEVASILGLIADEAEVVGEALSSDLSELSLEGLQRVGEDVVKLGSAPRSVSGWGRPAAAESAEVVLLVAADDLRAARAVHARVYERFTDAIWLLPESLLRDGRRPWRVIARARLRAALRSTSRTGRVPGRINRAAREVLEVRAARERLTTLGPLLMHHLAGLDRGPLLDVDDALAAVRAVRALQDSLGELLDPDRLQLLLLAEAFRSPDVIVPARGLRDAIRAWRAEIEAVGGRDALGQSVPVLSQWVSDCAHLLPVLREGIEAMASIGAEAPTLASLVETLLIRQRVAELSERAPQHPDAMPAVGGEA